MDIQAYFLALANLPENWGWWTFVSPLLIAYFLLKVSNVAMLERTIETRRPKYADYIRRTDAFFPWLPKRAAAATEEVL